AGAGEVPAELGVAAGRCGALRTARAGAGVLGAAAAGGQRETADESERGERDELVLANVHCESFRGPWAREAVQREGLTAGTLRSADDGPPARAGTAGELPEPDDELAVQAQETIRSQGPRMRPAVACATAAQHWGAARRRSEMAPVAAGRRSGGVPAPGRSAAAQEALSAASPNTTMYSTMVSSGIIPISEVTRPAIARPRPPLGRGDAAPVSFIPIAENTRPKGAVSPPHMSTPSRPSTKPVIAAPELGGGGAKAPWTG